MNLPITISDLVRVSDKNRESIQRMINEALQKLALSIPPPNYNRILVRYNADLIINLFVILKMLSFTNLLIQHSSEIVLESEPEDFTLALINFFNHLVNEKDKTLIEFTNGLPISSEAHIMKIFIQLQKNFYFIYNTNLCILKSNFETLIINYFQKIQNETCNKYKPIIYVDNPSCSMCQFQRDQQACPRFIP